MLGKRAVDPDLACGGRSAPNSGRSAEFFAVSEANINTGFWHLEPTENHNRFCGAEPIDLDRWAPGPRSTRGMGECLKAGLSIPCVVYNGAGIGDPMAHLSRRSKVLIEPHRSGRAVRKGAPMSYGKPFAAGASGLIQDLLFNATPPSFNMREAIRNRSGMSTRPSVR
jgi:hypothetical protein